MHRIKIIGAKCEIITPEKKQIRFDDLYNMVFYIKKHKLEIENLEVLPDSFRQIIEN